MTGEILRRIPILRYHDGKKGLPELPKRWGVKTFPRSEVSNKQKEKPANGKFRFSPLNTTMGE